MGASPRKTIAVGSDSAGAPLREVLGSHLRACGYAVEDYGTDDDAPAYPAIALTVAQRVAAGEHDRAILCCGTGIGVAITANKVPGVYAALCHDTYSAERARKSNAAQVLTMGARVIGPALAIAIVQAWMGSEFEGGRSESKVDAIRAHENELQRQWSQK